ncbi:MAG: T9SS type A sorting domain-containing protein [Bacteroidia bacterium]
MKTSSCRNHFGKSVFAWMLTLLAFGAFSSLQAAMHTSGKAENSFSITATETTFTLRWTPNNNIGEIIIARAGALPDDPGNFDSYTANAAFGSGSPAGNGFVIYKGTGNKVVVTGLTVGTTYFFSMFQTDAAGNLTNTLLNYSPVEITLENSTDANKVSNVAFTGNAVVCAPVAGITCTLDGSSSSGYIGGPAPCNTGSFGGSNPWDGASCTGYISWTFSSPISKITIQMIAVNTAPENTTISQSGGTGGTLSLSGITCMSSAGLVLGPYTGSGFYGDVAVTITSTGTFKTITCTNTGCASGWVSVCATNINLPIELLGFKAECNYGNGIDISWKTATEKNNNFFTLERSTDATTWETLEKIPGAGNSSAVLTYNYNDPNPPRGTVYYHLKQTDYNGEEKYSNVISAENCGLNSNASIYPNPATKEVFVKAGDKGGVFEMYNMLGRKVISRDLGSGENKIDISGLSTGTYYAQIVSDNSASGMSKLIISN